MDPPNGDYYAFWKGRDGLATKIRKDLKISANNGGFKMIPIFESIMECLRMEKDFDPKAIETRGGQRPVRFDIQSAEAQIVADGIESGLSVAKTWHNVNWHRSQNGEEMVSQSCIISLMRRIKPKVVKIKKRKMGSSDPTSTWAQARKAWATQLLARLGEADGYEVPSPVERRFHRDTVGRLDLHQIIWWDETHRKCLIGELSSSKDYALLFPRNSEGKLDLDNGQY